MAKQMIKEFISSIPQYTDIVIDDLVARHGTGLMIEHGGVYEDDAITLFRMREETDSEFVARREIELELERRGDVKLQQIELKERQQYERLKAKYG